MLVLALDTCFDACSAAVLDTLADRLVARFEPMATGHAERLVPMIGSVMAEAGVGFDELHLIAVTNGPGTFTGTRIGVAAARSLALAAQKPLLGASSLAVIAAQVAMEVPDGFAGADILVAMDARRDEVYFQGFRNAKPLNPPAVLCPLEAIDGWVGGLPNGNAPRCILAGTAAKAITSRVQHATGQAGCHVSSVSLPSAAFLARLAPTLSHEGAPVSPLYLRPADAKPQIGKSISRVTT
ncbi:MAG: tRNA (adenosine(37)-N6)-threonylcarbamoyltransferase complex dimerization subunit type 1 TsaB [Alphaproteobacteria bacterium]|nr:tRNA (adenosine(37)-N6)-threonylcarbamoyltransferase complex dimerization subunit type 1 TsaB [Alphaproteobacteria bacterium]